MKFCSTLAGPIILQLKKGHSIPFTAWIIIGARRNRIVFQDILKVLHKNLRLTSSNKYVDRTNINIRTHRYKNSQTQELIDTRTHRHKNS